MIWTFLDHHKSYAARLLPFSGKTVNARYVCRAGKLFSQECADWRFHRTNLVFWMHLNFNNRFECMDVIFGIAPCARWYPISPATFRRAAHLLVLTEKKLAVLLSVLFNRFANFRTFIASSFPLSAFGTSVTSKSTLWAKCKKKQWHICSKERVHFCLKEGISENKPTWR